jgi:hypothetical protein
MSAGLIASGLIQGCATSGAMETYVPARCHGVATPFTTYTLQFVEVPGFIEPVIETSLNGALAAIGLSAASPGDADVKIVNSFFLIDRNPVVEEGDPFGEEIQTGSVNRFVTHLKVDLVDQRNDAIIWTGAMYRPHAIHGSETFHDDRAILIIRQAFDEMFVGLLTPCE